ncbi:MAG TPA: hypothetical protein VFV07_01190 [Rhizomicrobium sp.]|nr:hypothetical protein [Rhizomicrobium sp.]
MSNDVAIVALVLACLAFALYAAQIICQFLRPATPVDAFLNKLKDATPSEAPADSIPDITALIQALSGLVGSLIQAGPTLTSLIASIFFMAIAVGSDVAQSIVCSNAKPCPSMQKQITVSARPATTSR